MAFGNGTGKTTQKRLLPLALGCLTDKKQAVFARLRTDYLKIVKEMCDAVWCAEPLTTREINNKTLLLIQQSHGKQGLKVVYPERCRLDVLAKAKEANKQYFKRLMGGLRFCAKALDHPWSDGRIYATVPPGTEITDEQLTALAQIPDNLGFDATMDIYKAVCVEGLNGVGNHMFTDAECAVFREIWRLAKEKHNAMVYDSDGAVTIPLDSRYYAGKDFIAETASLFKLLRDDGNAKYQNFLAVTHPYKRNTFVKLPVLVPTDMIRRLISQDSVTGSIPVLVISKTGVTLNLVVERPLASNDLSTCTALMGADPGMKVTMSATTIQADGKAAAKRLETVSALSRGRSSARDYLSNHVAGDEPVIDAQAWSGGNFQKSVMRLCRRIDATTKEIDLLVDRTRPIVADLKLKLGVDRIEPHHANGDHAEVVFEFFAYLAEMDALRQKRKELYRRIAGVKKSWFNFIANRMVEKAQGLNAGIVIEDSTWVTPEVGSSDYKGRTFNRIMNNSARGQLVRAVMGEANWNGVPFVTLGSWFTSQTCFDTGVVDSAQRKNAVFKSLGTGKKVDADLHASEMFARYLTLVPKPKAICTNNLRM